MRVDLAQRALVSRRERALPAMTPLTPTAELGVCGFGSRWLIATSNDRTDPSWRLKRS